PGAGITGTHGVERTLGGEHAGTHCQVNALEAYRIQESTRIASDQHAVGVYTRDGVPASFRQRLGAVANELSLLEQRRDERMLFEVLKDDVRIEHRIAVVEPAHEANRHQSVRHDIDERAAELLLPQRIAHRVHHGAGGNTVRGDFPELL